jgi:hypothetical protein
MTTEVGRQGRTGRTSSNGKMLDIDRTGNDDRSLRGLTQ